jgi:nitrite reductase (NADH) large subunit
MVSGHAYGKALRTVKTCVGTDWCRFGTQDSTGLGVRLGEVHVGVWTPAKVEDGVSGCPRNCAEATCKDVGVICVDSGFEIHIGGAGRPEVRRPRSSPRSPPRTRRSGPSAPVTQLYRERPWYLERIWKWMDRVGLETHPRQIEDPEQPAAPSTTASPSRSASSASTPGPSASPAATATSSTRFPAAWSCSA